MVSSTRAVFLDRDGVLAIPEFRDGRSFAVRRIEDFRLYDDAAESCRQLKTAGFLLVVVTNQPDVGEGLVKRNEVEAMHRLLSGALPIDAIETCYHTREDGCDCRKPRTGMLCRAATRYSIDASRSFLIGDRGSDIEAGQRMGCTTILIDRGYCEGAEPTPDHVVSSLAEATGIVTNRR